MNFSAELERLVNAASKVFFGGAKPTFDGHDIGNRVYFEETKEAADGSPILKDGKWGVKITETVRDMSAQQPHLALFALAHELGHLVAPHVIPDLTMSQVESVADLIALRLLRETGAPISKVVTTLQDYGTLMFDDEGDWAHPPADLRIFQVAELNGMMEKGSSFKEGLRQFTGAEMK